MANLMQRRCKGVKVTWQRIVFFHRAVLAVFDRRLKVIPNLNGPLSGAD